MKLKGKLNFGILSSTFVVFFICTLTTYIYTKNWAEKNTYELLQNKSVATSIYVKSYFEDAINKVVAIEDVISILKRNKNSRRNDYRDVIKTSLEKNENYLSIWSQYEANTMDNLDDVYKDSIEYGNKGRFQHAFYKANGKVCFQFQPKNKDEDLTYLNDYYLIPKQSKTITIVEPYMYDYVGDKKEFYFETSVAIPDFDAQNNVIGVIGIDLDLKPLQETYKDIKLYESGYCQLITNKGVVVTDHNKNNIGLKTKDSTDIEIMNAIKNGKNFIKTIIDAKTNEEFIVNFTPIYFGENPDPWILSFRIPKDEVFAESNKLSFIIITIEVISLIILGIIIYVLASKISTPLLTIIDVAKDISKGNLKTIITGGEGKDEINELIRSLQEMTAKLKIVIRNFSEGSLQITATGIELNQISKNLTEGTNLQFQGAEETSASIKQISASIKLTSENAKNTELIYKKVVSELNQGYEAVDQTLNQMKLINEKVRIINELASQTNLLALNAAVEAARAGEHGKGFSVIATEVRKLAEKSRVGANEINELTEMSLSVATQARDLLFELLPDIQKTVKLINEIAVSNTEQEHGINQINEIANSNYNVIKESTSVSEQMSKSAEELLTQAELLKNQLSFFDF